MRNPKLRAFNTITEFADSVIYSFMQGWGFFTAMFIFFSPVILMMAAIKWLLDNGYIS